MSRTRPMLWSTVCVLSVVILAVPVFARAERSSPSPPSVTVLNFVNRTPRKGWTWLSSGLADMLTTDLHRSGKFLVVTREDMASLFEEMELGRHASVDARTAARFGKTLKARWAVTGSYAVEGSNLVIEAQIVDVETQDLRRVEQVEGPAAAVLSLEKQLARALVANFDVSLTDAERAWLTRLPTLSLPAAQCHYEALAHYDAGRYADALAGLLMAVRQDEDYADARFRLAQVYCDSGEHAHAHLELQRVLAHEDAERRSHTLYRMAHLEEDYLGRLDDAAERFMTVAKRQASEVVGLFGVKAALRAALIHERLGRRKEAYAAYAQCVRVCKRRGRQPQRYSIFPDWNVIAAMRKMRAHALWHLLKHGELPDPDCDFQIVAPGNAVVGDACGEWADSPASSAGESPLFYNLAAAPGYAITGMTVEVELALKPGADPRKTPGLQGCGAFASDISRPRHNRTLGYRRFKTVEAGPHRASPTFINPVAGCALKIRPYPDSLLTRSRIEMHLARAESTLKPETMARLDTLLSPASDQWTVYSLRGCLDPRGGLLLAMSQGTPRGHHALRHDSPADRSRAGSVDLWTAGGRGTAPESWRRVGFNSLRCDLHPSLAVDGDGRYRMVFASNRWSERQTSLWMAVSENGADWSHPRRLAIDVENGDDGTMPLEKAGDVKTPALRIDNAGGVWLAFQAARRYYVTRSEDGYTWPTARWIGSHHGGHGFADQTLVLGANHRDETFAAMHGVFIKETVQKGTSRYGAGILVGRIRPDLTFACKDFRPKLPYLQLEHGWRMTEMHLPLAFGELPDGRHIVVSRHHGLSARNLSLLVSVSRDLDTWQHARAPAVGGHYRSAVACLVDTRAATVAADRDTMGDLVLIWHEDGEPRVRRVPIRSIVGSP